MTKKQQFLSESAKIRKLARSENLILKSNPHADEEMAKDNIFLADRMRVLKSGYVVKVENHTFELRYNMEGLDCDSGPICLVVEMFEMQHTLSIVTGWRIKK